MKQIDHELLKIETIKTEILDKRGNTSYKEEYMLYEAVLVPMTEDDIETWKEEKQLLHKEENKFKKRKVPSKVCHQ